MFQAKALHQSELFTVIAPMKGFHLKHQHFLLTVLAVYHISATLYLNLYDTVVWEKMCKVGWLIDYTRISEIYWYSVYIFSGGGLHFLGFLETTISPRIFWILGILELIINVSVHLREMAFFGRQ